MSDAYVMGRLAAVEAKVEALEANAHAECAWRVPNERTFKYLIDEIQAMQSHERRIAKLEFFCVLDGEARARSEQSSATSHKNHYTQEITLTMSVEQAFRLRDVLFASDDDRIQGIWGQLANLIGPYQPVSADHADSGASDGAGS